MANSIKDSLNLIKERLAVASGKNTNITVVAVSKTRSSQLVWQALQEGQLVFGENRIQEALPKMEAIRELCLAQQAATPAWHFVGNLQSNKARFVRNFVLIPLSSISLAAALQKQAEKDKKPYSVLIQTNFNQEKSKAGVSTWEELDRLAENLQRFPQVQIKGLMTIPPPDDSEIKTREVFANLRQTLEKLQNQLPQPHQCHHLSMGMSRDFEWAIAEGSTIIRLGTAIFGTRN